MTLRPLPTALLVALVMFGVSVAPAPAQRNELPAGIVGAIDLTADQKKQIDTYIENNIQLMASKDRAEMKRGRDALLRYVSTRDATVVFRLYFGGAVAPRLQRLAGGDQEPLAINALIVAGTVATRDTVGVLDSGQQDPRVAVRFAAFAAGRRVFRSIGQSPPAIAEPDAIELAERVARRLVGEADPQVFDAGVRTLIEAAEVSRQGFEELPARSRKAMAAGVGERLRTLPCDAGADSFLPAVHRGGTFIRAAAARLTAQLQADPEAARVILELGGDIWAHVLKRIEAGQSPPVTPEDPPDAADRKREHRANLALLVAIGRDLMYYGASVLTSPAAFEPSEPADWVRDGTPEGDKRFVRRARDLLGPGGIVTKPPLNLPEGRFGIK